MSKGAAVRSKLLELLEARASVRRGREVLEQKLELLRRELKKRMASHAAARAAAKAALSDARRALREATIELGPVGIEAAALAQRPAPEVRWQTQSVAGVHAPQLALILSPFELRFSPGGTSPALDEAATAHAKALPLLVALAGEDQALRSLRRGLMRTGRRLNALEKVVLPEIEASVREARARIEEDERDEAVARRSWLRLREQGTR